MAKSDAIAKAIAADPYLKKRKAPTEAEQQLYLKEVSFSVLFAEKSFDTKNKERQISYMRLPIFFRIVRLKNNMNF